MKYLFVLFLAIGAASAYTLADQDEALANSDVSFVNFGSAEERAKVVERLQDALKRTVETMKKQIDQGHEAAKELVVRAHKLAERLHQLHADMGEKLRAAVESYQGKAKEFVQLLKDFFNRLRKPTEAPVANYEEMDEALANADINFMNFASNDDVQKFVEKLQEALKRTVETLKKQLDEGEKQGHALIVRAHKLAEKLKHLGADMGVQLREAIKTFQGHAKEFARRLREFFRREHPTESSIANFEEMDEALANADVSFVNFASNGERSRYVERLQEALKRTVETLKQRLDEGHDAGKELIVRAHKLADRLRQLHADMGEKLRVAVESYQGKAKEFVQLLKDFFHRMQPATEATH